MRAVTIHLWRNLLGCRSALGTRQGQALSRTIRETGFRSRVLMRCHALARCGTIPFIPRLNALTPLVVKSTLAPVIAQRAVMRIGNRTDQGQRRAETRFRARFVMAGHSGRLRPAASLGRRFSNLLCPATRLETGGRTPLTRGATCHFTGIISKRRLLLPRRKPFASGGICVRIGSPRPGRARGHGRCSRSHTDASVRP